MALLLASCLIFAQGFAAPITHVQVRIVTGGEEFTAGSQLELRIYEAGKNVRHVALTHGESWPRDSTRVIPLVLPEGVDPRSVVRFGLYYRAASPLTPPLEVLAAEVDLPAGGATPERLLNATRSGVIAHQGELATEERDAGSMTCATDADCDDHRNCNGHERCAPRNVAADARGCVKGMPVVCPVNQVCTENHGCRGLAAAPAGAASAGAAAADPAAASK